MKERILNLALVAALMVGLGAGVVSCKDDDNDEKTEEQKEQEVIAGQQKDNTFWAVVGQLVSMENYTDDYAGRTFTPTIGTEADGDPLTRIVSTNSMEAAVQNFLSLVNVGDAETVAIDENTISYEWKNDAVGTLTYRKTTDGTSWATVDVSISQVPTLRHIVYQSPEQGNQNGSVDGKAYYRFGDVVSRKITVDIYDFDEYWICIRPAFGPEGKGDSHWACVNILPEKNIKHIHFDDQEADYEDYYVPTGIGENKKQMQNFAELLYAIYRPDKWQENISYYSSTGLFGPSGLPIFNDFHSTNLRYHNKHFWQKVQDAWDDLNIPDLALNTDAGYLPDFIDREGISLLCNGYSWWSSVSWNCKLYQYTFTNGTKDTEKNLHHADYTKPEKNVKNVELNCKQMGQQFLDRYNDFFGDSKPRWAFRTLTGKELASDGRWDNKQPIAGVTEVYRYYAYYPEELTKGDNDGHDPEETVGPNNDKTTWQTNEAYKGMPHYRWGDLYKDDYGNIWLVASMSGIATEELSEVSEKTPYAEFVSLADITTSADNRYATNLPTRDQVIRGYFWLDMVFSQNSGRKDDINTIVKEIPVGFSRVLQNMVENMNVDPRDLIQRITAQNGDPRSDTEAVSIPYQSNDGKQHLLRIIRDIQNDKKEPIWYIWEHYPKVASADDPRKLTNSQFSTDYICLEDIASADMIAKHNLDWYVTQPLSTEDGMVRNPNQPARTPRGADETDAHGLDITTCFYNRQTWYNRTFTTDMWRSPVLPMRVTACYDRGDSDYADITVDGIHLTPYKLINHTHIGLITGKTDAEAWKDHANAIAYLFGNLDEASWILDGRTGSWPSWRVWNK